jgi:hypothetical protein
MLDEDHLDDRVLKPDRAQPLQVCMAPGVPRPRPQTLAAQQQLADPMAAGHQVAAEVLATAHEIAQGLIGRLGNHDRPQLACRMQSGELQRVALIGLGVITGLAGDRPRRADHHLDPRRPDRPGQTEARRPGLIDRANLSGQRLQPRDRCRARALKLGPEHLT